MTIGIVAIATASAPNVGLHSIAPPAIHPRDHGGARGHHRTAGDEHHRPDHKRGTDHLDVEDVTFQGRQRREDDERKRRGPGDVW